MLYTNCCRGRSMAAPCLRVLQPLCKSVGFHLHMEALSSMAVLRATCSAEMVISAGLPWRMISKLPMKPPAWQTLSAPKYGNRPHRAACSKELPCPSLLCCGLTMAGVTRPPVSGAVRTEWAGCWVVHDRVNFICSRPPSDVYKCTVPRKLLPARRRHTCQVVHFRSPLPKRENAPRQAVPLPGVDDLSRPRQAQASSFS
mmetsp:Transcript_28219/g.80929  ORF Transcript_28219/g.80929 Transcript_28219/m.80929 type:complete len:200 (+) Transcript_28219:509-1108(+)